MLKTTVITIFLFEIWIWFFHTLTCPSERSWVKIDALNSQLCLYNLNLNQIQYSSLTHSRLCASKRNTRRRHPSVLSCLQVRAKLWKMLRRPPTRLHKSCKLSANCECHLRSCTLVNGQINHGSCQRQINKFSHHGVKVKNTKLQLRCWAQSLADRAGQQ